jgi:hypothetical protein
MLYFILNPPQFCRMQRSKRPTAYLINDAVEHTADPRFVKKSVNPRSAPGAPPRHRARLAGPIAFRTASSEVSVELSTVQVDVPSTFPYTFASSYPARSTFPFPFFTGPRSGKE